MENFEAIILNNYKTFKQRGDSTFHKKSQLHRKLKKWEDWYAEYLTFKDEEARIVIS